MTTRSTHLSGSTLLFSAMLLLLAHMGCNFSDPFANQNNGATAARAKMGMEPDLMDDLGTLPPEDADMSCMPLSDAELCSLRNAQCGMAELVDDCLEIRQVDCGPCASPSMCDTATNLCSCVPQSDEDLCDMLGYRCGGLTLFDNCGALREIACGSCSPGVTCENNRCDGCEPESSEDFCSRLGATCGTLSAPDNCGVSREVVCGSCEAPEVCTAENVCACQPESSTQLCVKNDRECGAFDAVTQCGDTTQVDCGPCDAGECQQNKCTICTPESDEAFCARQGVQCGAAQGMDNCGGMRTVAECGPCNSGEQCNLSQQCVCPTLRCRGDDCGTISNACGNTRDCGGCDTGELCSANSCECPAVTCGTNACGTISNACGASANCGSCSGTNSCINNVCVCQPETDAELCQFRECGNVSVIDRCGASRTVNCGGGCPPGDICSPDGFCCPKFELCIQP